MKSKLFSRIAAVVLAVMMLGTVSFADSEVTLPEGADSFATTLPSGYTESAQLTFFAYAVPNTVTEVASIPAFDGTQEIVAVEQVASSETAFSSVSFNSALVPADSNVAVVLGGSNGNVFKSLIIIPAEEPELPEEPTVETDTVVDQAVDTEITIGETTYTNVAAYDCEYTPTEGATVTGITFTFKSSKEGATPVELSKDFDALEGPAAFKAVIIGLPDTYFDGTYTITVDREVVYEVSAQ